MVYSMQIIIVLIRLLKKNFHSERMYDSLLDGRYDGRLSRQLNENKFDSTFFMCSALFDYNDHVSNIYVTQWTVDEPTRQRLMI